MVKFIAFAVTAFVAVASAQTQDGTSQQETGVPQVPTTPQHPEGLPACVPLNFQDKTAGFVALNNLIDVAVGSGMVAEGFKKDDPMAFQNKSLGAIPFELLNSDFSVTPTIKTFNFTGLSTLTPRKLDVVSPENIKMGVDFNGTVGLTSTMTFEIVQLNRKSHHPCWTDFFRDLRCNNKVLNVEFKAAVANPSIGANLLIAMLQCPSDAPAGTCTDVTVNDLIAAAMTKEFDGIKERLLRRVKTMSITEITVAFEQITELHFNFERSGPLLDAFYNKIMSITKNRLNKKQDKYNDAMETVGKQIQTVGNQFIQEKLQPGFGNTCYDA